MYIPADYKFEDRAGMLAFMRAHNFAALISSGGQGIVATHLPFVIDEHADSVVLRSHLAKANPHWKLFEPGREALVIFQGPHAYISPQFYDSPLSVPTWNYAAVHAYGCPRVLNGNETEAVLRAMIQSFEAAYQARFDDLPADFRRKMINGIVAFEIVASRLEGKRKLSQNKTPAEQARIAAALAARDDQAEAQVGRMMLAPPSEFESKIRIDPGRRMP
jgi:transcriptional regulator